MKVPKNFPGVMVLLLTASLVLTQAQSSSNTDFCGTKFFDYGDYRYIAYYKHETWNEANKTCARENGSLAILNTTSKRSEVYNTIHVPRDRHYWVGLEYANNTFKWANGQKTHLNESIYKGNVTKWKTSKCFYVYLNDTDTSVENNYFRSKNCSKKKWFFCEVPISRSPDSGCNGSDFLDHEGYCYEAHYIHKTWNDANKTCSRENGSLAILNTTSKRSEVYNNIHVPRDRHYWVGLEYANNTFKWANGQKTHLNESIYKGNVTKWKTSKCFYVYLINTNTSVEKNYFRSKNCSEKNWFICEVPISMSPYSVQNFQVSPTPTTVHHLVQTTEILPPRTSSLPDSSMSSTLYSDTVKSSLIQPSSTMNTVTTSNRKLGYKDRKERYENLKEKLNTSDPNSMKITILQIDCRLDGYDDFTGTENTDSEDDDNDYYPLTEAQSIEQFALEYTPLHLDSNRITSMDLSNKEIAFHARCVGTDIDNDVVFPEVSEDPDVDTISIPKSTFRERGGDTYIVNVVFKNNKTIHKMSPKVMEGLVDKKNLKIMTKIFSIHIFSKKKTPFRGNFLLTLHHVQKRNITHNATIHCVFWNFSIPSSYNGSWSKRGCHVVSTTDRQTVCACDHLTSFAVLMQLRPAGKTDILHQEVLSIITYIGLALSLLGEAITVVSYCIFLNKRHEKIQIRVNLLCTLAAAQTVFLAGIDKTENKGVCTFIAATIHFFYLVSFCWMLMEGVYLYRMVVKVFDAHLRMRYSYAFAYGFPSCVVAGSLLLASLQTGGISSYIHSNYCWIRSENELIWAFAGPVVLLMTINILLLLSVIKEMFGMKTLRTFNSSEVSMIRASVRACVVLLPLLGITWAFGLLSLGNVGIVWQYIFTVLNTTQGLMIFIFHCLRNSELRAAIELRYLQWQNNHSNHSNHGRVTPQDIKKETLTIEDPDKRRSNSIPMTTKANKVSPYII